MGAAQFRLGLARPPGDPSVQMDPVPDAPTLIRALPDKPIRFADLDALARHLHRRSEGRPIRIDPRPFYASYGGSGTFPGFNVELGEGATSQWIGMAAVQSERPDALVAALERTREPRSSSEPEASDSAQEYPRSSSEPRAQVGREAGSAQEIASVSAKENQAA